MFLEVDLRDEEAHLLFDVAAEHVGGAIGDPITVLAQPGFKAAALLRRKNQDVVFADCVTGFYRYT